MATINSYCEKRKIKGVVEKLQRIFIRVKHDYKEFKFFIPEVKVELAKWDAKKQRVKGTSKETMTVNDLIASYEMKIKTAICKTENPNEIVDISIIRESFLQSRQKKKRPAKRDKTAVVIEAPKENITDFFDSFMIDKKNQYKPSSFRCFITIKKNLLEFSKIKDFDTAITNIGKAFYTKYLDFLIEDKKYINGTINNNFKKIKTVLKYAEEDKDVKNISSDHRRFKTFKADEGRYSNTLKEIIELYNMKIEDGEVMVQGVPCRVSAHVLEKVRDIYVFNFFSGLAYREAFELKTQNIKKKEISTSFVTIKSNGQEHSYKKEHFEVLKSISSDQYAIVFGTMPSENEKEIINNKEIPYTEYSTTETMNYLDYVRVKTSQNIISPLNNISLAILKKYEGKYLKPLPIMTEQKMNLYLHCVLKQDLRYHETIQIIKHTGKTRIETIVPRYNAITMHSARHGFATHLIKAGLPITDVQGMMGHADIRTTMIYNKTDIDNAILGAIERFKPKY